MSCILFNPASYAHLAQSQLLHNSFEQVIGKPVTQAEIVKWFFRLNQMAYANRYGGTQGEAGVAVDVVNATAEESVDYEFAEILSDDKMENPDAVVDLLKRVSYQCADIDQHDPIAAGNYTALEAIIAAVKNSETEQARNTRIRAENDKAQAEKQVAIDTRIAELKAANPWAVPESTKCSGVARASKNLKKQLTLLFPGTKFSVKSDRFSMGNSIDVSYMDGPAFNLVKPIVDAYQYGSFNGMEDIYEHDNSIESRAHEAVFGGTKYSDVRRSLSTDVLNTANDWIEARYGRRFTVEGSGPGYGAYFGRDLDPHGETAHIHRAVTELLAATSF